MRTTLDIDQDVLLAAKQMARDRGVSTGRVISALARQALTPKGQYATRNGIPLLPIRPDGGIVTPELVKELMDEES
jgi:hypothetical protein